MTMNKLIAIALIAASQAAGACTVSDSWTGKDKAMHLAAGVAVGSAGTLIFKDADRAFAQGVTVAIAKELADTQRHGHTCSAQDAIVTIAGAAAGAYGTGWLILPRRGGVQVGYAKTF
jgi:uncharacterized protein YfiM (DUF2279 family)